MGGRKPSAKRTGGKRKSLRGADRTRTRSSAPPEPGDGGGLVLQPPVPSAWSSSGVPELRVPTVALTAEILCADGRDLLGRIFVPASASSHAGAMRPEEWMNEPVDFFPFLPDSAQTPIILNKHEVLILSVPASVDADQTLEEAENPHRRVTVECGGRRLSGTLVIDMPQNQSRVLDYLNRAGRFLTLRDGDRHQLVQKGRITRVEEASEE